MEDVVESTLVEAREEKRINMEQLKEELEQQHAARVDQLKQVSKVVVMTLELQPGEI
jgi:hypothetical protein